TRISDWRWSPGLDNPDRSYTYTSPTWGQCEVRIVEARTPPPVRVRRRDTSAAGQQQRQYSAQQHHPPPGALWRQHRIAGIPNHVRQPTLTRVAPVGQRRCRTVEQVVDRIGRECLLQRVLLMTCPAGLFRPLSPREDRGCCAAPRRTAPPARPDQRPAPPTHAVRTARR